MSAQRSNRRSTFLWQALLILLPVVVLAVVGLISLRQDKRLADQEARERAQQIADDMVAKIWRALTDFQPGDAIGKQTGSGSSDPNQTTIRFQISARGELLFPPPVVPLIPRMLVPDALDPVQRQRWQTARTSEFGGADPGSALRAYREFIQTKPPQAFAAAADFSVGLLLLKQQEYDDAAKQFEAAIERYPEVVLESGLPLQPLARMKSIGIAKLIPPRVGERDKGFLETVCSNVVFRPTPLTPLLLGQVADLESAKPAEDGVAQSWLVTWQAHERARKLYAAAARQIGNRSNRVATVTGILEDPQFSSVGRDRSLVPGADTAFRRFFWFTEEGNWLAVPELSSSASDLWFLCLPEARVKAMVNQLVADSRGIPDYFGVAVELDGRSLIAATNLPVWWEGPSGKGGGPGRFYSDPGKLPPTVVATARKVEQGFDPLKISIHLTSPNMLYARQHARTIWFGLLIVIAAATAVTGLIIAWQAFNRQERLNEMKSNFVSSVSHELRAPIASVRLMAESLDRGKIADPQKQAGYFRLIVQECRRLTSLIENVLDFSRIDQGRKQYEFEPTDLTILVGQTVKLMEPYAADRHVSLAFDPPAETLSAEVDGKAIQQALVNLLDNAIKHSPPDAVVDCGLEAFRDSEPATFNLFVQDHGDGIPPGEHARIFEPFYRRGSELRRETPGVGIGLTIVKHIVEAHGGKVTVRSAVGQGSRFTIELPVGHSRADGTRRSEG